jgi:hypothetical protein
VLLEPVYNVGDLSHVKNHADVLGETFCRIILIHPQTQLPIGFAASKEGADGKDLSVIVNTVVVSAEFYSRGLASFMVDMLISTCHASPTCVDMERRVSPPVFATVYDEDGCPQQRLWKSLGALPQDEQDRRAVREGGGQGGWATCADVGHSWWAVWADDLQKRYHKRYAAYHKYSNLVQLSEPVGVNVGTLTVLPQSNPIDDMEEGIDEDERADQLPDDLLYWHSGPGRMELEELQTPDAVILPKHTETVHVQVVVLDVGCVWGCIPDMMSFNIMPHDVKWCDVWVDYN